MPKKVTTAQHPYELLVANLRQGSDPSRNTGGNPVHVRTGFEFQHFPEVNRLEGARGPVDNHKTPGLTTLQGHVGYTTPPVPVDATGIITVANTDFSAPATLGLASYEIVSGQDYDASTGTPYVGEDITNTVPDNAKAIFDTAGPNFINVPANLPITPGTVTIHWTDAGAKSQTDDGVGGFAGDGNPGGSTIDYATGAITLDTTGDVPDNATSITIDYTADITAGDVATNLAAAISGLPGLAAVAVAADVTVTAAPGPDGNALLFEAIYAGFVQNFTLNPLDGSLGGGEPTIGPPIILP